MKRMKRMIGAGAALVLAAALASCGDDAPSEESSSAGTEKDPLKYMLIADLQSPALSLPELVPSAQAAVDRLNASGGAGGREVELLTCNAKGDPNTAAKCARDAVSEDVAAVVGTVTLAGDAIVPVLEAGKIPLVGGFPIAPSEATSSISFPTGSMGVAAAGAVVGIPDYQDCKAPAIQVAAVAGAQVQVDVFKRIFNDLGTEPRIVETGLNLTDFNVAAANILRDGTDCVVFMGAPNEIFGLLKAIHLAGGDVKASANAGALSPAALGEIGDAAQGLYASTIWRLPGTPEGDQYAEDLAAVDPEAPLTANGIAAYATVMFLSDLIKDLDDVSGASVLETLSAATNIETGFTASLDWNRADSGIPGEPRANATKIYQYAFEGDAYKLLSEDPVDTKPFLVSE